jgi:hypothetical protein
MAPVDSPLGSVGLSSVSLCPADESLAEAKVPSAVVDATPASLVVGEI